MMKLPALDLPKIDLPFDIPALMHPPIDHFAIALPVIILLLEFYNLFAKRKTIGAFSFGLLILTVGVFAATYLSGGVDAKETFDLLSPDGQAELKAHKLLGSYLLVGSAVLLFFKLLAMTGKFYFKFFFFLALLGFIAATFKQGKDGGELVYEYGANIESVKDIKDELSDIKEELDEVKKALKKSKEDAIKRETIKSTVVPVVAKPIKTVDENKVTPASMIKPTEVVSPKKEETTKSTKNVIDKFIDMAKSEENKSLEVVPLDNATIE